VANRKGTGQFKKGNPGGPGGPREGAGRKPNWFKKLCEQELAKDKAKGARLVGKISRNELEFERVFNHEGKVVRAKIGGTAAEIIAANEFLRDSSMGKPTQAIQHLDMDGVDLLSLVRKAEEERGLPKTI